MAKLIDVAEMLQDMYYQAYRTDEDFFDLPHFEYICAMVYSKILENEYKIARAESKTEEGISSVIINGDYLVKEKVAPKKEDGDYILTLKQSIFQFQFDKNNTGIQRISNPNQGCKRFVRTNMQKSDWMSGILPKTDRVFFYGTGKQVVLKNVTCALNAELTVMYVPEISSVDSEEAIIPEGKGYDVVTIGMDLMKRARNGEVIDMTNNSNPNKVIQTEIDNVFTNLRTKPV